MSRLLNVFVIVVCAGSAGLLYAWDASSTAGTGPAEIRITSRETSRVRVDVGRPGRGVGDTEVVRQNLFNKRIKQTPIGHSEMVCTFTTPRTRSCSVTVFLPRGRLIAGGSIQYQDVYELAVLGGTRLYDNARGTLTVIRTTRKPRRQILLFRLTG